MTPVSNFSTPAQSLPRVPPEVWLRIFLLATDLDAALECSDPISLDLPHALVKQYELGGFRDSLRTKRSIPIVCRAWNELALEFLYQRILVTKVAALASLCDSLLRHTSKAHGKNRLGWWTKRLDVLIDDERCEASDYDMLAVVIRQFPNLSTITLSMPASPFNDCWLRQLPTSLIEALAETCGTSLQVFDCSESILRPCREDLMMLLAASPNLKVLRCPICSPTPADRASRNRLDVPLMPNLESITLMSVFLRDYLPRDKDANRLPALRQLTYDCIPPPFFDHAWKNFMKLTCTNLTSVTLDFCLSGDLLQMELDLLSQNCTALNRLVIYLRSWDELRENLILPPVSYLGLHYKTSKGAFHCQTLISALATLTAVKLRTVRLLHAGAAQELREYVSSQTAEERARLTFGDFSLEDSEGSVLFSRRIDSCQ